MQISQWNISRPATVVNTYLRLYRLLAVDINQLDSVLTLGSHPDCFPQIRGGCSTRFFLQTLRVCSDLHIVDANFASRGKFNRTGTCVRPKGVRRG